MSNVADLNYSNIPDPFDNNMNRSGLDIPGSFSGSSIDAGGSSDTSQSDSGSSTPTVTGGQSLTDVWLETWMKSRNFKPGSQGFMIDGRTGSIQCNDINITGGIARYGKTDWSDSTNAGWYLGSEGVYLGSAADATLLKFTIATGLIDHIGTISSRSTATIAAAINSSGNLITDIVNVRLNSSSKAILSDFSFGATDYAGAVKSGTITWNSTTGAITGGSGVVVYRGGIVAANDGTPTITLDATTGNATFAGTLSAPSGTLGTITTMTLTGGTIAIGTEDNIFKVDTNGIYLGNAVFASAPFRVSMAGSVICSNITVTGGTVAWSTVAGTTNAPDNLADVTSDNPQPSETWLTDGTYINQGVNLAIGVGPATKGITQRYHNFQIPFLSVVQDSDNELWTIDAAYDGRYYNNYVSVTGDANQRVYTTGSILKGLNATQDAIINLRFNDFTYAITEFEFQISDTGTHGQVGIGFISGIAPLTDYDDATTQAICITSDGTNVYAHTSGGGGGANHTETLIDSGITSLINSTMYRVEWINGTSAKFYLNGTLVATLTTNLPTTGNIKFGFGNELSTFFVCKVTNLKFAIRF